MKMQNVKNNRDLILTLGLSFVLLLAIYWNIGGFLRITTGFIYSLLFPGYMLITVLFPGREDLTGTERLILSVGLSFVLISLIGFLFSFTPMGISLDAVLLVILVLVFATCSLAFHRRSRLPVQEQFVVHFELPKLDRQEGKPFDALLSAVLLVSVLAVCALLIYALVKPKVGERFTEFYLLGASRLAGEYPTTVNVHEPITLSLGITNHEHEDAQYRLERVDEAGTEDIASVQLAHDQNWERPYTFALTRPGEDQRVEFLLYKGNEEEPYRSLHLWITVKEE